MPHPTWNYHKTKLKYKAGQPIGMNLRPAIINDTKTLFISEIANRGRAHSAGLQVGDKLVTGYRNF